MISEVLQQVRFKLHKKCVDGVLVVNCTVDEAIEVIRKALLEQIAIRPNIIRELRHGDLPYDGSLGDFRTQQQEGVNYVRFANSE